MHYSITMRCVVITYESILLSMRPPGGVTVLSIHPNSVAFLELPYCGLMRKNNNDEFCQLLEMLIHCDFQGSSCVRIDGNM